MTTYHPGMTVRLTASFTDAAGAAANPTTVTLVVETSDQTDTSYSPTNSATGTYVYDYVIADACPVGRTYYRFKGTGAIVAAAEGCFYVKQSEVLS